MRPWQAAGATLVIVIGIIVAGTLIVVVSNLELIGLARR